MTRAQDIKGRVPRNGDLREECPFLKVNLVANEILVKIKWLRQARICFGGV